MIRSGLIGRSILASRSPWLHEQEAAAQGLALSYDLFDFTARGLADAALGSFIESLHEQGYAGFNVTFPFKQAIIPLLDGLDESAATVGAVNTVSLAGGQATGFNSDMPGFAAGFARGLPGVAMARVLQLGCGGAGAAVASALLAAGAGTLVLADPDRNRSAALADRLAGHFGAGRVETADMAAVTTAAVDGIVNASPVGMASSPGLPLAAELIEPRHWVADIVYFPLETELLRVARSKGCRVLDGSGMVVAQAAIAFEIITGQRADPERMARSFVAGLVRAG